MNIRKKTQQNQDVSAKTYGTVVQLVQPSLCEAKGVVSDLFEVWRLIHGSGHASAHSCSSLGVPFHPQKIKDKKDMSSIIDLFTKILSYPNDLPHPLFRPISSILICLVLRLHIKQFHGFSMGVIFIFILAITSIDM